jgi:hypothetical protein
LVAMLSCACGSSGKKRTGAPGSKTECPRSDTPALFYLLPFFFRLTITEC